MSFGIIGGYVHEKRIEPELELQLVRNRAAVLAAAPWNDAVVAAAATALAKRSDELQNSLPARTPSIVAFSSALRQALHTPSSSKLMRGRLFGVRHFLQKITWGASICFDERGL